MHPSFYFVVFSIDSDFVFYTLVCVVVYGKIKKKEAFDIKLRDLAGQKFGMLTVIKMHENKKHSVYWTCVCDCGKEVIRERRTITNTRSKVVSCGCHARELNREKGTIHGMGRTRFYRIYKAMKTRVLNPNTLYYHNYGGRGIDISGSWKDDFLNFKNDMYTSYLEHAEKHGEKNTTLERIDVEGNYEKSNCKWATHKEQSRNMRKNQRTIKATDLQTGEVHIQKGHSALSEILGIDRRKITVVLNGHQKQAAGFSFEYID